MSRVMEFLATGRRKNAIARVRLVPGRGNIVVNGRSLERHFPIPALQNRVTEPMTVTRTREQYDVIVSVSGGGVSGQAGAVSHGISRALVEADPDFRGTLKKGGFLTRDPRMKERKKYGLKKARKAPQFSKR